MNAVSRQTIIRKLEEFCAKFSLYKDAAAKLNVTPAQLSTVLNKDNTSTVPANILKKLGYVAVTAYIHKDDVPKKSAKAKADPKPVAKAENVSAKAKASSKKATTPAPKNTGKKSEGGASTVNRSAPASAKKAKTGVKSSPSPRPAVAPKPTAAKSVKTAAAPAARPKAATPVVAVSVQTDAQDSSAGKSVSFAD